MSMTEARVRDLVDELIPEPHTTQISRAGGGLALRQPIRVVADRDDGDERFVLGLVVDGVEESVYELLDRVRSALQDWIAECNSGWGQER